MGILSKIVGDQVPLVGPSATVSGPSAVPAACQCCGSAAFWIDVYANPPHCCTCNPPPIPSMVRKRVWLIGPAAGVDGGADGAEPRLAEFRDGRLVDEAEDEAEREGLRSAEIERDGTTWNILAAPYQFDVLRQPTATGRYSPPLGVAPVGDMLIEEWLEALPEGLPGW